MRVCAVILLTILSLLAQAQQPALKADNAASASVEKLELDLAKLLIAGKWDEYLGYLSEDFVGTAANGKIEHKAQAWEEFHSGNNKMLDMIPEELQVTAYGDTAVVTGHVSILGRQNGKVITTFSRVTDVFVQRQGRWFLVASQATAVAK
jgi:ketosteroid isomerase-like protein